MQDADLEYDPQDYEKLLAPIFDGRADVVYGSRFLGGPQRVHYFWHYAGNKFLTLLSDMLTNLKLSDMETCYKVCRSEVVREIKFKSDRFPALNLSLQPRLPKGIGVSTKYRFHIQLPHLRGGQENYLEGTVFPRFGASSDIISLIED